MATELSLISVKRPPSRSVGGPMTSVMVPKHPVLPLWPTPRRSLRCSASRRRALHLGPLPRQPGEALVVGDAPALVQEDGHAGVIGGVVIRKVPRPQAEVAGVERFYQGERDLLVLFGRHGKKPPFAWVTAS